MARCARRRPRDPGSAAVWVVCACLTVWVAAGAALSVGAAVVGRHRASAAADLSALAAARQLLAGDPAPCRVAARVAAADGATIRSCLVGPSDVEVVVEVPVARVLVPLPPARARARAGGSRVNGTFSR